MALEDFHIGPYWTAVGEGEMLTEVRIPLKPGGGSAHEKTERRAGDWAIAAASAAVWIDGGTIVDAGIALSAVGPKTVELTRADELLRGRHAVRGAVRPGGGRSRRRTAPRRPTDGAPSTTSAISPAS